MLSLYAYDKFWVFEFCSTLYSLRPLQATNQYKYLKWIASQIRLRSEDSATCRMTPFSPPSHMQAQALTVFHAVFKFESKRSMKHKSVAAKPWSITSPWWLSRSRFFLQLNSIATSAGYHVASRQHLRPRNCELVTLQQKRLSAVKVKLLSLRHVYIW